jgi:hypothetical protein
VPLIADIEKVVYGAGKGNMQDKAKLGTILYNRGVSAAVLSIEALRKAQEKYGKGKSGHRRAGALGAGESGHHRRPPEGHSARPTSCRRNQDLLRPTTKVRAW